MEVCMHDHGWAELANLVAAVGMLRIIHRGYPCPDGSVRGFELLTFDARALFCTCML